MFYAHFVLAKKGPLSKIWLAAHWDKKLTKAHVFETNIETSVDGILKPKVKMALRTSGHLLLGVVRIYSRKAKYLLQDCNEAFVKIKMAFRPGMVDLPEEHREAAMNAITLPEVFHDFDTAMPDMNDVEIEEQFSLNQSRAEEITMREDYGSLNLETHDDGFGDMGFDTDNPDIMREAIGNDGGLEQSNLLFADGSSLGFPGKDSAAGTSAVMALATPSHERRMEAAPHAPMDDGFGGTIGDVGDFGHAGGLFEGDLFGEVGGGTTITGENAGQGTGDVPPPPDSDDDMPDHYDAGDSPHHSWPGSPAAVEMPPPPTPLPPSSGPMEVDIPPEEPVLPAPDHDNTTLLQNDEESFALAPVDTTVLKGITKTKRKRKLIVDEVKNISGEEMKNQLSNTSDIVTTLDLAPPTRRLMHWKETGGVEKLFTLPAKPIPSKVLFRNYQRNIRIRQETEENEQRSPDTARRARSPEADMPRRPGRKRKHEEVAPPETPAPHPAEMEAPVPQDYEPSVEHNDQHMFTPRADEVDPPSTPGMLSSLGPPLTPGGLGPLTPGTLLQGGLTPAGLQHGDDLALGHTGLHPGAMTPGLGLDSGLMAGGLTPAGLHHGGMTPHHGGMTPHHGGMTPHHGGMTPIHGGMTPHHGGMTPHHGGMTPHHGGMTPVGLDHGCMTPAGLQHGGMTPAGLQHGGMTPSAISHNNVMLHGLETPMLCDPGLLPRDQLPLPHDSTDPSMQHADYQTGLQMANLGYDGQHSPQHDYDLPPSVEQAEVGEREAGETEEQFSERVLNRRAAQLFSSVRPRLTVTATLTFTDLAAPQHHRKQVAQKFYSLLVLKKHQVLKLEQEETYGTLYISRGEQFETDAL